MELSLRDRLVRYFEKRPDEWVAKGGLCDLVRSCTNYTAENVGRRLRELENDGILEVKYVKNHAHYKLRPRMSQAEMVIHARELVAWFDTYAGNKI